MKYYKLKKDLPYIKAGEIYKVFWDMSRLGTIHITHNKDTFTFTTTELDTVLKEWFEPCLFISEDNEPIFEDDSIYAVFKYDTIFLHDKFNMGDIQLYNAKEFIYNTLNTLCKIFKSKEKAQEYLNTLKPKFKVGDVIVILINNTRQPVKLLKIENGEDETFYYTDWNGIGFNRIGIDYATNSEIIKYYESQGWGKGAKFSFNDKTCYDTYKGEKTDVIYNIRIEAAGQKYPTVKGSIYTRMLNECTLIKEPELPKSWHQLRQIKGSYITDKSVILNVQNYEANGVNQNLFATESQAKSALAYAQLSQLVAVMNDGWKPNWNNKEPKYIIRRCENYLEIEYWLHIYYPLALKSKELAEFSLEHHRKLWEEYYELWSL